MFRVVEKRNLWFFISLVIIVIGLGLMVQRAFNRDAILNYGIDFTGGSSMILKASNPNHRLTADDVQSFQTILDSFGLVHHMVQLTQDQELLVKTSQIDNVRRDTIIQSASQMIGALDLLEADMIGPSIGAELRQKSLWIILSVSLVLLLYISWRFELMFGLSALAALLHDGLITLSIASILFIEVDSAFVAALLTILGYSINDTIVIFDRLRENIKLETDNTIQAVANRSISQTMVRSINTSLTTLVVIGALYLFGGVTIKSFCLVLLIGVLSGTYSSIFIASPLLASLWKPIESD